jgi:hypothetical protein
MSMVLPALMLVTGTHARATEKKVRRIEVKKDQIVLVKTAPTIATIIQVPDRPNSVVLGNQGAFQIEYLDTAVTIKPLTSRSKGNLYIYTDYRRYSVELVTGSESAADYIVYFDDAKSIPKEPRTTPETGVRWRSLNSSLINDDLSFSADRIGERLDGYYLVEFTLSGKRGARIDPAWFWITQGGKSKPIHNLFLSALIYPKNGSVSGTIVLLRKDFGTADPIRVEIRRRKTAALLIPKVALWK